VNGLPSPETPLGRAVSEWRDAIVRDLGGADALSTQQVALVDVLVRTKLLLDTHMEFRASELRADTLLICARPARRAT
jgi:hypothetical protein